MKKFCCMIALAAISFGSVYAAVPATPGMQADTTMKMKKKKVKMKTDTSKTKIKMKKDTTKKM